jgi:hypothetical protein
MTPAAQLLRAVREILTERAEFDVDTGDYHLTVPDMATVRAAMNLACEALADAERHRPRRQRTRKTVRPTRTHQLARLAGAGV